MGELNIKNFNEALLEIEALKIAIVRERKARERAETLLENRATHLFKVNQRLQDQYVNTSRKNQEINYLLKITNLESDVENLRKLMLGFLEESSMLLWSEASFVFKENSLTKAIEPLTCFFINLNSNELEYSEKIFVSEDYSFLKEYVKSDKKIILSDLGNLLSDINPKYLNLNFNYLFKIEIDEDERYFFCFSFQDALNLEPRTIELVESGLNQLVITLQKHKANKQLIENYKKIKEIKSQLIQSEKMASLGTISAGIAHEINNPLSFVLTNSEVLKEYLNSIINYIGKLEMIERDESEIQSLKSNVDFILQDTPMLMNESLEGIERIRQIVNGLRTFSRADDGEFKSFDVNSCIETSLRLVSNELKHKCKVVKKLNSSQNVFGSAGQIIQVFTNFFVNSAQAIEEFGEIEISTFNDEENVFVSIRDNGKGISKENLNNLFTPFFTTKPTGQGTGLGLSISYGIIKKHNGKISVESEVGLGTTFLVSIPITSRPS